VVDKSLSSRLQATTTWRLTHSVTHFRPLPDTALCKVGARMLDAMISAINMACETWASLMPSARSHTVATLARDLEHL